MTLISTQSYILHLWIYSKYIYVDKVGKTREFVQRTRIYESVGPGKPWIAQVLMIPLCLHKTNVASTLPIVRPRSWTSLFKHFELSLYLVLTKNVEHDFRLSKLLKIIIYYVNDILS